MTAEVHELFFGHGILGDHLLDVVTQSHAEGIFIIRCGVEEEDSYFPGTVLLLVDRHLDAAEVVHIVPGVVALGEVAIVLLHLVEEILEVLLKHILSAVRPDGHVGRSDKPGLYGYA